ncbi:MAG TPA: hypothetical protein VGR56_06095 [Nitrososphaerales archaeon]|nr:hypothetical protein [Nitrososphaerales archaeon]
MQESSEGNSSLNKTPVHFSGSELSNKLFDYLVKAFIDDYMRKNYIIDRSGWRSFVEAARAIDKSPRAMYGKFSGFSPSVNELLRRGLVEIRSTPGQRGRGGITAKVRISYGKRPVQVLVDRMVWGKERDLLSRLEKNRIAVLSFENISPNQADEYLAEGFTEELIDTLSKIRELNVISRTSTLQYKGKSKAVREIGRELDVGTVLEGSVRKSGNRIRINVQMIDAMDDRHVWAEEYDRELQDIFEIQRDIAHQVATALRIQLLSAEKKEIAKPPTVSIQAYQSYLRGRFFLNHFQSRDELDKALMHFHEAIGLDPNCAVAYAGVSHYYHIGSHRNWFTPEEAFPRMKEYVTKAIQIDPSLAEAHGALGAVYFHYDWKWQEAEKEFRRAIELRPNYAAAFDMYQHLLAVMGDFEQSYELIARGAELSPRYGRGWGATMAEAMILLGKVHQGIALMEEVVQAQPDKATFHDSLGFAYYRGSRIEDATLELRKAVALSGGDADFKADLGLILALSGNQQEANEILEDLARASKTSYVSTVKIACIQYALGMQKEAFSSLRRAYERKAIDLPEVRLIPELSQLLSDPRWLALEALMSLPNTKPATNRA